MQSKPYLLLALIAAFVAPLTGCGKAEADVHADSHDHGHDHDHGHEHEHGHDHGGGTESLHAAFAELTQMHDMIRDAILAGDPNKAHGPLHTVPALLDKIPEIAADTDLPKAEWEAVKAANEELYDAFTEIDKAFHEKGSDKKAVYEGVADKLNAAFEAIRSRLPLTGEEPEAAHDHHDHGDDHDHGHDHDHEGDHDHEDAAS